MRDTGRGRFISVEGGEGVGKSLFIGGLADRLLERGLAVETSREPGGTTTAERLRQIFAVASEADPLTPVAELLIVAAARAQHVRHKIIPTLASGRWLVCDRFSDSTAVYQGALLGLPAPLVEMVDGAAREGLVPDLTFLLDCDEGLALERLRSRHKSSGAADGAERYDSAGRVVHEKLRQAYLELATRQPERIVVLDAAKPAEAVVGEALMILERRGLIECQKP